jgi:hypothetical protein
VRWFIQAEKPRSTVTGRSDGVSALSVNAIDLASGALADAIRGHTALTGWPNGVGPMTVGDTYRIRDAA